MRLLVFDMHSNIQNIRSCESRVFLTSSEDEYEHRFSGSRFIIFSFYSLFLLKTEFDTAQSESLLILLVSQGGFALIALNSPRGECEGSPAKCGVENRRRNDVQKKQKISIFLCGLIRKFVTGILALSHSTFSLIEPLHLPFLESSLSATMTQKCKVCTKTLQQRNHFRKTVARTFLCQSKSGTRV